MMITKTKKKRKALEKRKISEAEYDFVTALLMGVETVQILQKYETLVGRRRNLDRKKCE